MKCEGLVKYISDYIDQDLNEELTNEAQEHLSTCKNCRVMLDTTQQMIFLYREKSMVNIPAARKQNLFSQLESVFLKREDE